MDAGSSRAGAIFRVRKKSLALDDSNPSAHVILGRILLEQRAFDAAVAETNRRLALAPKETSNSYCLASGNSDRAAEIMNWSGRPADGLEIAEKAMRRDPTNGDFHLMAIGMAYYQIGRSAEAIAPLKRFTAGYFVFEEARLFLAASYAATGMIKEARAEAVELMKISPGFSLKAGSVKNKDPQDRLISDLRKAGLK